MAVLQTEHERIDMVLLDLTMPGMSGVEVLEIALEKYPNLPIVLCSGYLAGVSGEIEDKCLQLPKPFTTKRLLATIAATLS